MRSCLLLSLLLLHVTAGLQAQAQADDRPAYGNNIITATVLMNNCGRGYGLQYERMIDDRAITALHLPVAICYGTDRNIKGAGGQPAKMFFCAPGFSCYPTGNSGVVRYAIGLDAAFGIGQGGSSLERRQQAELVRRTLYGFAVVNSIQVQPAGHFPVRISLGLGLCNDVRGSRGSPHYEANGWPFGQLSCNIGYRW